MRESVSTSVAIPVWIGAMSEPLSASRRSVTWVSTAARSSDDTLSPRSLIVRSAW